MLSSVVLGVTLHPISKGLFILSKIRVPMDISTFGAAIRVRAIESVGTERSLADVVKSKSVGGESVV